MLRWLTARVLNAVGVVLATILACSALIAIFVPEDAPQAGVWAGTLDGVRLLQARDRQRPAALHRARRQHARPFAGARSGDLAGMDRRPTLLSGSRPWFSAAAALCLVGFVAAAGTARAVVECVAGLVLLLACTRYIAGAVKDDPVRSRLVARSGLQGAMAEESGIAQRRRAPKRVERR